MTRVTLIDACVATVGVHRGALAASYVARYAMTQNRLGKFPTAVEYAGDWKIAERSAWNHRARMEAALGDSWPDVVDQVARHIERRHLSLSQALGVSVPALAAA